MLTQDAMLKYAHRLVLNSPLFSAEESVGIRIMTLVEHSHNVEMVVEKLERDIRHAVLDGEDTKTLSAAVKHIKEEK